jgi:formylglycine-generating enzyme required for sulfatase activity
LLPGYVSAQDAGLSVLDSRSFARFFDGQEVSTTINLRAEGDFSAGHRAYLYVDIDSTIASANGSAMPRVAMLNGYVVIALPRGLDLDGQPRLQYFDASRGRYEYMYSKAYPRLPRFAGLEPAMENATSSDPKRILQGITEITSALDPNVAVTGPSDPRLTGTDTQYALTGVSWLIPCNVMFSELVGVFDPQAGLAADAKLRINVPLKTSAALVDPRIVLFVGGLSAAVNQVDMQPAEIPPTAIPLAPVPVIAPDEPAEETGETEEIAAAGQQVEPQAESEGTQVRTPARGSTSARSKAGTDNQDEEPDIISPPPPEVVAEEQAEEETAADVPPPPQLIPVLVYSYDWLVWETELDLSPVLVLLQTTPTPVPVPVVEATSPSLPAAGEASFDVEAAEITPMPGTAAPTPDWPVPDSAPTSTTEEPDPEPESERADSVPASAEPVIMTQEPGVTQVEPGTLPSVPTTFTVPLKPITGTEPAAADLSPRDSVPSFGAGASGASTGASALPPTIDSAAAGGMAAGAYTPPVDLGQMVLIPEGYFLMGTSTTASAGDIDEMPQTQVFLPAYYIDKYPVTNRQFHNFVISAGFKPRGNWDKYYLQGTADLPVRGVNWEDASAYAAWAGKRLPTEAEWEKAARGEAGATYPWGEDWSADILPRGKDLHAIMTAEQAASPYGVMGTVGLVWQWTASAHHDYPFNPDARGPKRVLRGGTYGNGRNIVRCANRYAEPPNVALNTFSFRCAKDAP